jgi:predicted ATP-grasp superfamily ATP-dependent carboligase
LTVADREAQSSPAVATPGRSVLIGFADALAAPETAWSLVDAGYDVVAFARRGTRPALRRCHAVRIVELTPPERDALAAIDDLTNLLRPRGRYRAVMPLDDAALWLCDQAWRRGIAVDVAGPTGSTAELALDKQRQLAAAAEAGLAVPPSDYVESVEQLLALPDLPIVLKPARPVGIHGGRLTRGANYVCGNEAELHSAARRWAASEPLLAQPLMSGVGEGLFGLANSGKVVALSTHRRVRMMNPQGSGSSACVSAPVDAHLAAGAERMLSTVAWRGLFMLEFLRDRDGTAWFMELNGRTWGSMALARCLGLEYPAWAIRQLDEPELEPVVDVREGQICRHLGRELVHLMMVFRGPKSVALTDWPSRRLATRDVFRFRRSDRWYNCRRGEAGLFVEDALGTVLAQLPRRGRR